MILVFILSCGENRLFEKNYDVNMSKWATADSLLFNFDIEDNNKSYDLFITIRNTPEYSYRNLYLFLKIVGPNGKYSIDTVECVLADGKGKWLGNISAGLVNNTILYKKNVQFPSSGKYHAIFTQAMRTDTIKNIASVGMIVDDVKNNQN